MREKAKLFWGFGGVLPRGRDYFKLRKIFDEGADAEVTINLVWPKVISVFTMIHVDTNW